MKFRSRTMIVAILAAGFLLIGLFAPVLCLAGSSPVVTVNDSSSGGAINFGPPFGSTGSTTSELADDIASGGSVSVEISPGVEVTVTSVDSAVNNGSLGRDQVASGFGSGGVVVTLSAESVANVLEASEEATVDVDGQIMTPLDALLALSTSADLGSVRVTMPTGVEVDLASILTNVTTALTSRNPTSIGTALNDASIALTQALKNGESASELKSAAVAIANLLAAARQG